jgi:GxxExxY protein
VNGVHTEAQRTQRMARERDPVSPEVIGAAIAVHRALGPGLLESVYGACLSHELTKRRVPLERDVKVPVRYDGREMQVHFRLDLVVRGCLVLELKSVEHLLGVHQAQLITYLRLTGCTRGLLINFNVARLADGVVRVANRHP